MKPFSILLWIVAVGAMASGLFQLKYAVQAREGELVRLNRDLIASERAVHVLHAEWSYLNRPERLAGLAARHLDLAPMTPGQIGSPERIGSIEALFPPAAQAVSAVTERLP